MKNQISFVLLVVSSTLLSVVCAATVGKVAVPQLRLVVENESKKELSSSVFTQTAAASSSSSSSSSPFNEGDILRFSFSLSLSDHQSPQDFAPQQVFMAFSHPDLSSDLVFVASHSSSLQYSLTVVIRLPSAADPFPVFFFFKISKPFSQLFFYSYYFS